MLSSGTLLLKFALGEAALQLFWSLGLCCLVIRVNNPRDQTTALLQQLLQLVQH